MAHEEAKARHPFVKGELIDRIAEAGGDPGAPWDGCVALDVNVILKAFADGGIDAAVAAAEDNIVEKYRAGQVTSGDAGAGMILQLKKTIERWGL